MGTYASSCNEVHRVGGLQLYCVHFCSTDYIHLVSMQRRNDEHMTDMARKDCGTKWVRIGIQSCCSLLSLATVGRVHIIKGMLPTPMCNACTYRVFTSFHCSGFTEFEFHSPFDIFREFFGGEDPFAAMFSGDPFSDFGS